MLLDWVNQVQRRSENQLEAGQWGLTRAGRSVEYSLLHFMELNRQMATLKSCRIDSLKCLMNMRGMEGGREGGRERGREGGRERERERERERLELLVQQ